MKTAAEIGERAGSFAAALEFSNVSARIIDAFRRAVCEPAIDRFERPEISNRIRFFILFVQIRISDPDAHPAANEPHRIEPA